VEKESKGDDALKSDRLVALSCTDKYFTWNANKHKTHQINW
jgi:hypothetical protein